MIQPLTQCSAVTHLTSFAECGSSQTPDIHDGGTVHGSVDAAAIGVSAAASSHVDSIADLGSMPSQVDLHGEEIVSPPTLLPPVHPTPYPLKVTVEATPAAVRALLSKFGADKTVSDRPVAIVSGGSISGYAAALALARQGFNVLVVEKRDGYSRQNILALKQDAIFSLARLAPDQAVGGAAPTTSGLLRAMRDKQLLTVMKNKIQCNGDMLTRNIQRQHRFMEWVASSDGLPSMLPQLKRTNGGISAYLDAQESKAASDSDKQNVTIDASYLDLAFPSDELIGAVKPDDWRLGAPEGMRTESLVAAQVMDFETGLNDYCAAQPGIDIVQAEVQLQQGDIGDDRFVPVLKIGGESVRPDFPVDLICIAEGAQSKNQEVIGGALAMVAPNESWRQRNYVQSSKGPRRLGGFEVVDTHSNPFQLTVTGYIEQSDQSLAMVWIYAPTNEKPGEEETRVRMEAAQKHVIAGGAIRLRMDEGTRQFYSGDIDVKLLSANVAARSNTILVGDAFASGSPIGGYGASMALCTYPEAVERLVSHPLFKGTNGVIPKALLDTYHKHVSSTAEVLHGRASDIMRGYDVYTLETRTALARQIAKARFGKLE
ncbi:hypothetical protein [Pandoraea commovens]|uniref:Rhodanese domain-containing protein n=1 Tax=Pandoraea commovens TaxID=2508289 RepID=A0ABY5QLB2_9BURK|nr:hypothetical protein [Pandoraea commovens]UVA80680.1 hypothetical protein NTU39_06640 [Pandoraea commovens]